MKVQNNDDKILKSSVKNIYSMLVYQVVLVMSESPVNQSRNIMTKTIKIFFFSPLPVL